jgi:hypothetical protein
MPPRTRLRAGQQSPQGKKSKALAAVELAALLCLLLTSAALPGAPREGWVAVLVALGGLLLLAAFLVALAGRPTAARGNGAVILVAEGQVIPADGEIIDGAAVVDEAAITGVSGGVVRDANSDRSAALAGTLVVSGRILVRTTTGSHSLVRLRARTDPGAGGLTGRG